MTSLGHLVFYAGDLETTLGFCTGVMGLGEWQDLAACSDQGS
jgi:catechol 2,3-dioxygenase-like lactoylglutathione lyase family enzyme